MPCTFIAVRRSALYIALAATALAALSCSDSSGPDTPQVDARIVAFSTTVGNSAGLSLFLMHADGTSKTRLTNEGFLDEVPVWSPDGATVAFDSNREPAGIWIVNADGTNLHAFVTSCGFDRPSTLAWSPDGTKIAFTAHVDTVFVILVANANGTGSHRLTTNAHGEQRASWSPDGTKIAFESRGDATSDTHIFVINADGTNQHQLTTDTFDGGARWSPDGTQIVFDRGTSPGIQVFVMNADGSNQHALTTTAANFGGSWSPDGHQLTFTTLRSNNNQVARMNADGSDVKLITSGGTSGFPAWKPTP